MEFFQANIQLGEVVVQLLAFIIVFWTMKLLAWKPLLKSLESRRERIKSEFERIDEMKREIEALKSQYNSQMQKIDDEARAKLQQAIEEGRRIAREIQDKARAESQDSFEKAKENILLEAAKARITMRHEIADLTIGVSEKVLREKMSDAKQQEKILELIKELETA